MTELLKSVMSLQDAANYKLLFERTGFNTLPEKSFEQYQTLLEQENIPLIDPTREAIIVAFKIQEDRGGFLSFVKTVAISVRDVSLYFFATRGEDGKYNLYVGEGEVLITNARIIILSYKPKTTMVDKIYYAIFTGFDQNVQKIERVEYETNILVLTRNSTQDVCLSFNFPESSLLLKLGSTTWSDNSASDHMTAMQNKQDVTEYKEKATNAKQAIYQFFLTIRELLQVVPKPEIISQKKQEITHLLKKLNELKEVGILTETEYQEKKKELLNRL